MNGHVNMNFSYYKLTLLNKNPNKMYGRVKLKHAKNFIHLKKVIHFLQATVKVMFQYIINLAVKIQKNITKWN
jgi:hypothetical protein